MDIGFLCPRTVGSRTVMAGSYGRCMFSSLRKCHAVF